MTPRSDGTLDIERELRAQRPTPRPEFAAELDARAARGFARPWAREQAAPRSRFRLRYALGAASVVLVTAVAVSASGVLEEDERSARDAGGLPGVADQFESTPQLKEQAGDATSGRVQSGAVQPTGPAERRVARTAELVLSTSPDGVRDVADGIVEVAHRYRGFVVSSNVSSADGQNANADFELKLPARTLQPALDDLSELGHVSSLAEGTDDITSRFTTGRERIAELTEQRDRLRAKLEAAGTVDDERAIRVELRQVRDSLSAVRSDLADASERVRFVPVHVGVTADAAEVETGWSIGDALDDALRVLEVSVAVTLIALAGALPVAIVAALTWLATRAWVRRRREQALDEEPQPG